MKKLLLISMLILINQICFGQTYSDIIPDKEIISFLSWEVNSTDGASEEPLLSFRRKIDMKISSWDSLNFIKPDSLPEYNFSVKFLYLFQPSNMLDTIFSDRDKQYLFEQFKASKDSVWRSKIPKAIFTNKKIKRKPNRYFFSIPLFSIDSNYVIINIEYYCGSECAHGGYFIYRRLDENSWELIKVVNGWIS